MTWILTKSGIEFDLANPTPEMVDLSDIAHSLSNIKRFNGHTDVNCSVALHSVIMSYAVPEQYAKHALLHDAHETYIGDISSPLKELLGARVGEVERVIDVVISKRLNVGLISATSNMKKKIISNCSANPGHAWQEYPRSRLILN